MRARRYSVVALAIVIAAAISLATGHEHVSGFSYIQNGSFEAGTDGWHSGNADLVIVGTDEVPPAEGNVSARVDLTQSFRISQSIFDLSPGEYTVSAFVRRNIADTQVYLQAQASDPQGGGEQIIAPTGVVDEWIPLTAHLNLATFADVQVVIGANGAGRVYVDDVRFDGTPPVTATPTLTAPAPLAGTGTVPPTSTRTGTPTRTPSATATPTEAPQALRAVLENGGFEDADGDGGPTGWSRYGGELSLVSQPVHSGTRAGRLTSSTDSTKWLYQSVTVDPGANYLFDAWLAIDGPSNSSALLRISWYESDDASGRALAVSNSTARVESGDAGYRHLTTGSAAAPDNAHSARLRVLIAPGSGAAASVFVDDTSFGPSDESALPTAAAAALATDEGDDISPAGTTQATHAVLGAEKRPARAPNAANPSPGARVVINEVLYDPADAGPDGTNEWVELYNAGDQATDLTGWTIADAVGAEPVPGATIGPHEFAVLAVSDSFIRAHPAFGGRLIAVNGRIGNGLGNEGDRLTLRDASGASVDAISWGSDTTILKPAIAAVPAGHSIERRAPGADTGTAADFVDNESPSPGAALTAPAERGRQATLSSAVTGTARSPWMRTLPWILVSAACAALVVTISWRALPAITARIRQRA